MHGFHFLPFLNFIFSLQHQFVFFAVIVGEAANFSAYAFAPAILVTPLGAISVLVRYF